MNFTALSVCLISGVMWTFSIAKAKRHLPALLDKELIVNFCMWYLKLCKSKLCYFWPSCSTRTVYRTFRLIYGVLFLSGASWHVVFLHKECVKLRVFGCFGSLLEQRGYC